MIPQRLCELCTTPYTPPLNRPEWPKCIACTLTPVHARLSRRGPAPAYDLPRASADVFTFIVPGPPVGKNRIYRAAYAKAGQFRGAVYKTDQARRFQLSVGLHAQAVRPPGWSLDRKYELELHVYFDNPRSDSDGPIALTQDALQGVAYRNDNQVVRVTASKSLDVPAPRMVVTVRAVDAESIPEFLKEER